MWNPKCITKDPEEQDYGFTPLTKHILPCCWADKPEFRDHFWGKQLMIDELSMENVGSVEDIILSDEWLDFVDMLNNRPEEAPKTCWKHCGKGDRVHRIKIREK
jgi:hypothetical protein